MPILLASALLASPCIAVIRRFFDNKITILPLIDRHHAERRRFDRHRHTGHRVQRAPST
ncbi:hypothetical protein KCP71_08275 [Salmonella enterica subsp. enterica]|nr:hypothetical protein KCP71_08275 [Salmonella enterica subsp. enterica]